MSLLEFIRLLQDHLRLLISIPLILAVGVGLLTWNKEEEYSSKTLIYTGLVSGYSIESGDNRRIDYFAVNNAFDNLINIVKARQTLEEVGLRLLALHLVMAQEEPQYMDPEQLEHLRKLIPADIRRDIVDSLSAESIFHNLNRLKESQSDNRIRLLLNRPTEIYSIEKLSSIAVSRISTSDMIEISYSSTSPRLCQDILSILVDVVAKKQKQLKKSETGNVLQYFVDQTQNTLDVLRKKEEKLRQFKRENKIINYYEQTKYIASHKNDLDFAYQQEKMAQAAAEKTLLKLESRLGLQKKILERNVSLVKKREKLSEVATQIILLEAEGKSEANMAALNAEVERLKNGLRDDLNANYQLNQSTEGIPRDLLLDEWFYQFLLVDQSRIRAAVLEKKREAYEKELDLFAPLGSTLTRLERQVDVAERTHLEMLHSLNLCKLRQQNIELSTAFEVLDPPFLPLDPKASNSRTLVLATYVGGLLLCIALIIGAEYFDQTLKTPHRANEATGLELLGSMPLSDLADPNPASEKVRDQLAEQVVNNIKIALEGTADLQPPLLIILASVQAGEGKSHVGNILGQTLYSLGEAVLHLRPVEDAAVYIPGPASSPSATIDGRGEAIWQGQYKLPTNFYQIRKIEELLDKNYTCSRNPDIIFLEIPALLSNQIPLGLLQKSHLSLLMVRANRGWNKADQSALDLFCKVSAGPVKLLLNGLKGAHLEEIIGEVQKDRSPMRKFIKRLARFEFGA